MDWSAKLDFSQKLLVCKLYDGRHLRSIFPIPKIIGDDSKRQIKLVSEEFVPKIWFTRIHFMSYSSFVDVNEKARFAILCANFYHKDFIAGLSVEVVILGTFRIDLDCSLTGANLS